MVSRWPRLPSMQSSDKETDVDLHPTSNPAGSPKITDTTPGPKPPRAETVSQQDPEYREQDFAQDLAKATRRVERSS